MTAAAGRGVLDRLDAPDPDGMLARVERSPAQWREALELADRAAVPVVGRRLRAACVAGMGGSGIAGDVAVAVAGASSDVPVVAVKDYALPGFVGPDTLVVLVSHSGDTEETLSAYDRAGQAGAARVVVSSGGALSARAAADGVACLQTPPAGPPRANLAHLTVPVLVCLERAGALRGIMPALDGVAGHLDGMLSAWRHDRPVDDNPVKRLAAALHERVPVFYAAGGLPAVAARRAKCQVNENAERPAFCGVLPEIDHNEIVGWSAGSGLGRHFGVVELRSHPDEDPRIARRFDVTREVIADRVGAVATFESRGPTPIARFAAVVLFVDLLSVYLAYLDGTDPTPVEAIDTLKRRLAEPDPSRPDA